MFFKDRIDAGQQLAQLIDPKRFEGWDVVGIARGGVIIASKIADRLRTKCISLDDKVSKGKVVLSRPVGPRVLLCDDGLVTGVTLALCSRQLHLAYNVERVVKVVPIVPGHLRKRVQKGGGSWIYLRISSLDWAATGLFYYSFDDVSEGELAKALGGEMS